MQLLWTLACFQTWSVETSCQEVVLFNDADGDGYGGSERFEGCLEDSPYESSAETDSDCDDSDATVNPGAAEVCDGLDQDCDGVADNGAQEAFYQDQDQDGYGDSTQSHVGCEGDVPFTHWSTEPGDCDDTKASVYPGADELCDGEDQDCDGTADNSPIDGSPWYVDEDKDGYGLDSTLETHCGAPGEAWSTQAGDCDDTRSNVYPGAPETCDNGLQEDCSGAGLLECRIPTPMDSDDFLESIRLGWGSSGMGVAVGEVNGGSGLDVVLVSPWSSVAYLDGLSSTKGTSNSLGNLSPVVAVGDLDGSKPSDVVMISADLDRVYYQPGPVDYPDIEQATDVVTVTCQEGEVPTLAIASKWDAGAVVLVGHPSPGKSLQAGTVEVVGGSWGSGAEVLSTVKGVSASDLGRALAVSDLDGDGIDDLVVASRDAVYLLDGGISGDLDVEDAIALQASVPASITDLALAGDALGDGGEAIWVGTAQGAWLWDGSVSDVEELGVQLLTAELTLTGVVAGGVDIDSDGNPDMALAGYTTDTVSEAVALHYGPFEAGTFEAGALIKSRSDQGFGADLLLSTDLSGDASGELLVVTDNGERPELFVYEGGGL